MNRRMALSTAFLNIYCVEADLGVKHNNQEKMSDLKVTMLYKDSASLMTF